ncbi:alanine--tRNA ligase [Candidatus Parcubacteria bacterium]|nr:MAG: alanine--tRNA ligase [Candidatus Parcubacteria bacterium]
MNSQAIRQKFLAFFKERGHTIVPSSSLIPDDPSVLLTTAGMQQFKPYFTGELDPMEYFKDKDGNPTRNTVSIQKSFRTSDIDEVGDESHLTFFEMLGNFSFGGYFKEKAIEYGHEFITKEMGLSIDYVSVFEGDSEIPADAESEKIWKLLGVKDIRKFGRKDNFWGPTGAEGPCGPTTEIYVNSALRQAQGKPPVEVWNIVFNEYYQRKDKKLEKLKTPGVDTGMGLERLAMVVQNKPTIFETDLFVDIAPDGLPTNMDVRFKRIMLDHARAVAFLIADGVRPSNKDQGYILRRLVRRMMAHFHRAARGSFSTGDVLGMDFIDIERLLVAAVSKYGDFYENLKKETMLLVFREENERFRRAINNGVRELKKVDEVDAKQAFKLFESYGLTYEILKDFAGDKAKNLNRQDFDSEFAKHQEISRAGQEKKFGGHGLILDTGELKAGNEEELKKVLRLHTATHLLQQALREVLGKEVGQRGSDITAERTRFDFSFPRKVTLEEIKKVEEIVNQKIKEDLPVNFVELPKAEAEKVGALYFFKEKYPEKVKVYFVGKTLETAWSKEFCGGPHVKRTGEVGKFRISKEEAVGSGVRRIRGVVE